nr:hypothetical protein [uncultured Bradyrhizobium sp.]
MIQPTVGRVLHYFPSVDASLAPNAQPYAALLASVVNDTTVNLTVSNPDGTTFGAQNIQLVQGGDQVRDPTKPFARWMAYQIGQAAKTEQVSAAGAGAPQLAAVHQALDTIATTTKQQIEGAHQAIASVAASATQEIQSAAAPLHEKVTALESGTQAKFAELGDWLTKTFHDLEARLSALTTPPATPAPATPAPAPAAAPAAAPQPAA